MNAEQQNKKNIESLMRLIKRAVKARKFTLCFANCSSLQDQTRYIEEIRQRCRAQDITLGEISLWNRGVIENLREVVWETLKQQYSDHHLPSRLVLQVTGLEISILLDPDEQTPTVLQSMNMGRERFVEEFPYPFLIWLPDYAYAKLATVAPDFWSIRYGSYTFFCGEVSEDADSMDQLPIDRKNRTQWRDKMDQISLIERILETEANTILPQTLADLHNKLGDAYRFLGKIEKARKNYEEALRLSQELRDNERKGAALNGLGLIYTEADELEKAVNCFETYLELRKQQGKQQAQAIGYNHLGFAYDKQGNYEQAIACYQQALECVRELRTRGDILGNLGLAYRKKQQYEEAIHVHQSALLISREIGNSHSELKDLGNLGLIYHELGEYEKAMHYYGEALQLSLQREYKRDEFDQRLNIGDAWKELKNGDQAKTSYSKAFELAQTLGNQKFEFLALEKLQELYCPEGFAQPEQEQLWVTKLLNLCQCSEAPEHQFHCMTKVLEVCQRPNCNNHIKREWLFSVEKVAKKLQKQFPTEGNYCEKLIEIYTGLGNDHKVKEYQQKLENLKEFRNYPGMKNTS